jgi:GNAT superfamily N-acetyltransferase
MEQVNGAFNEKFKEILQELSKYLKNLKGVPTQEILKLFASIEAEEKKKQEEHESNSYSFQYSKDKYDKSADIYYDYVKVYSGKKEIAHATFISGADQVSDVWVEPRHRGKGIAAQMYALYEKETGISLKPRGAQTDAGKALWKRYSGSVFGKKQEVYEMNPPWDGIEESEKIISGRDLLDVYYEMTPDEEGSDRVERILREVGKWKLARVPISEINFSEGAVEAPGSKKLIKKYSALKTKMPPVILDTFDDEYEIVDGFHRIAAAKARGDVEIEAYVPA